MKIIYKLYQKEIHLFFIYILIILFDFLYSIDVSLIKINYLNISKRLYYVYAFNDDNNGDLYFEYWGENSKTRYFLGISATTGKELYFNDETVFQIESNAISIYHDSILIKNNEDNNIFSLNFNNLDYINLKQKIFTSQTTKSLISENKCDSSYRNPIVKLKNNNYLLSIVICQGSLIHHHEIFFRIFNFNSENIDGYNEVKKLSKTIGYSNSTSCFQTENEYIECAFCLVLPVDGFAIGIYDLNFKEYAVHRISYVNDYTFNKIFHFKKEIGVYLYFDKDTNVPKFQIKNLNAESFTLESLFEFDSISLNGNGVYSLNNGLFYSDGITVDESRIVTILTTQDLLNFIICIFDLYNDDKSLRVRYYKFDLEQINIKISVNIYAFKFLNSFGVIFYNSNLEYPGYTIFGYPNITDENIINNSDIKIKLFVDSISYYFAFSNTINLSNNIFGDEIIGIKIINFPEESQSGVIIKSSNLNSKISLNIELDINDQIIFEPNIDGAIPGEYILEFSPIIKEINSDEDSNYSADIVEYYGETNDYNYQSKTSSLVYKLIYIVECYERCKTCTQLGSEAYNYCVECIDEFPYNMNNGEKCLCDKYLHTDDNGKISCIEDCNNEEYKYTLNEIEKYCLSSCLYNNEELYLDEDSKTCYKNCSFTKNGNIYIYENKCKSHCPENYISNSNNECIFKENPTINFETSILDKINTYPENPTTKSITTDDEISIYNNNNIENETISSNINTNFETSLFDSNKTNSDSSKLNDLKIPNETSSISIDLKSDYDFSSLNNIYNDKDKSSLNKMDTDKTTSLFNSILNDVDTSSLETIINSDKLLSNDNKTTIEFSSFEYTENYTYTSSFNTIEAETDISSYSDINSHLNNSNTTLLNSTDTILLSDLDSDYNSSLEENNNNKTENISIINKDIDSISYKNINTNSEKFSGIIINNHTEEAAFNTLNISQNKNEQTENSFIEFDIFFNEDESKNNSEFFENNLISINRNEYLTKVNLLINNYNKNNSELEIKTENNCTIYCYSSKADINNLISLNPNLYYINLKECENKLIKENSLDEDSDLLIIINDNQNNRSNFFYEIYTRNGVKISNLEACQNTKIELSSPIFNLKETNYDKAILLHNQGYDIYNIWSNFYYDFCTSAYIDESDLTLNVRQQEIFPNNVSICMNGCSYNGIDLDIKRFYCLCNPNLLKNEENSVDKNYFEEVIEDNFFTYIVDMINYKIFSCYKLAYKMKNYFYNFGFYYAFGINFLNIILLFIYHNIGRKKIKIDFLRHEPNVKKRKEIEEKFSTKLLATNIKDNKDSQFPKIVIKKFKRKKKKIKTHTNKNYDLLKSYSNPVKKKRIIENKRDEHRRKNEISKRIFEKKKLKLINKNNQSEVYFESSKDKVFKDKEIFEKIKYRNYNLAISKNVENEAKIDYNELSYYEALQRDNRSFLQIFFSVFNLKLEIIQLSFYSKEFSHKSLTLPLYLFNLLLDLTINALLFSDDIISQKYYNNGKLKILTSNLLSIFSIIISNIILYFARVLINNYEIFNIIVREIKNKNDYYRVFIKISCILRLKIAVFFLLVIIIEMVSMYYLFIFCAIYKKLQKNLFINYIIGSCWQLGYTIAICFMIALLRKIGLNKKVKRIFIISRYIDDKL